MLIKFICSFLVLFSTTQFQIVSTAEPFQETVEELVLRSPFYIHDNNQFNAFKSEIGGTIKKIIYTVIDQSPILHTKYARKKKEDLVSPATEVKVWPFPELHVTHFYFGKNIPTNKRTCIIKEIQTTLNEYFSKTKTLKNSIQRDMLNLELLISKKTGDAYIIMNLLNIIDSLWSTLPVILEKTFQNNCNVITEHFDITVRNQWKPHISLFKITHPEVLSVTDKQSISIQKHIENFLASVNQKNKNYPAVSLGILELSKITLTQRGENKPVSIVTNFELDQSNHIWKKQGVSSLSEEVTEIFPNLLIETNEAIRFSSTKKGTPYYSFTNFYEGAPGDDPMLPQGLPTYSSSKGLALQNRFKNSDEYYHAELQHNPSKDPAMKAALKIKFNSYPQLKNLLLKTNNKEIINESPHSYWGIGTDGKGQNKLGKLLMEIRKEMQQEMSKK